MMHMVVTDIACEPPENGRQLQESRPMQGGGDNIPIAMADPLNIAPSMLNGKQPNTDDRRKDHDRKLDHHDLPKS